LNIFVKNISPTLINALHNNFKISPTGHRLAKGVFWNVISGVISKGAALLSTIVIARIVGKEAFGEFGIIQSTIMMMGVFASFGTSMMATKYVAEYRYTDSDKVNRILGLSISASWFFGAIVSVLLVVCAPWIAAQTIAASHLSAMLEIGAIYLLFSSVNGAQIGALSGFEAFRAISKINLISGVISFPIIGIAAYNFGLTGALWGYNITALLNCVLCQYTLDKVMSNYGNRSDYKNCLKEWRVLWRFSLPAMLANTLVGPVTWVCNVLLVNQPNGFAEMGVYSAATQWRQLMLFFPGLIAQVALPIMASSDTASPYQQIKSNFYINLVITLPLLALLSVCSPFIMSSYGSSFSDSWPVLLLVLCAAFLQVLQSPIVTYWAATGRMWTNFIANIFWGSSLVVLSWLFIEKGAMGLSLALLISFAIYGLLLVVVNMNIARDN
jgi:O-antigen/teichoic acid export membrane protein